MMDSSVLKVTALGGSSDQTAHAVDAVFNTLLNPMLGAGEKANRFTVFRR
jgi:hypothetical protein